MNGLAAMLLTSGAAFGQAYIGGGTARDASKQIGSNGINGPGAVAYALPVSPIQTLAFQDVGGNLIANYTGFAPPLSAAAYQVLTGKFSQRPPPVSVLTAGTIGGGRVGGVFSAGPPVQLPRLSGGGLAVQPLLAPTLGNPAGPSGYGDLLNRIGAQIAPPAGLNLARPAPGLNNALPDLDALAVPLGGALPRGMKPNQLASIASLYSRARKASTGVVGQDPNDATLDPDADPATVLTAGGTARQRSASALNPAGASGTGASSLAGSPLSPLSPSATGTQLGGRSVSPTAGYSRSGSLLGAGSRSGLGPGGVVAVQGSGPPPSAPGQATRWLDDTGAGASPGSGAPAESWTSAVEALRAGSRPPPERRGPPSAGPSVVRAAGGLATAQPALGGSPLPPAGPQGPGGLSSLNQSPLPPADRLLGSGGRGLSGSDAGGPTISAAAAARNPVAMDASGSSSERRQRSIRQARQALEAGQYREAAGAFGTAAMIEPLGTEDTLQYLEALLANANFDQAAKLLEQLITPEGSLPDLSFPDISPSVRTVIVRDLQTRLDRNKRLDFQFWQALLTLSTRDRNSRFRQLQIDLSLAATSQPEVVGNFSPRLQQAVLSYLTKALEP